VLIPTILTSGVNVRTTWFAEWRFTSVQLIHLDDFRTSCLYLLYFFGFSEFMTERTIGPTWIPGDFVRSPRDREVRFQTGRLPVKPETWHHWVRWSKDFLPAYRWQNNGVVGWEKGQTNSIFPKQFESRGSWKICFTQPLTKTVSKHVTGNHGYSIYNNLKFAFEAAKN
jgi:hypothetical protein